jgi:hypothetical protein
MGLKTIRLAMALAGLLWLAACGSTATNGRSTAQAPNPTATQAPSSTATQDPSPTATQAPNPTGAQGADSADSVLKRRDAPPTGVEAQFAWFGGGDGTEPCPAGETPSIVPAPGLETILAGLMVLDAFELCFPGFPAQQPVTVEIRRPDGKTESLRAELYRRTGTFSATLVFGPNDPRGNYTFLARQGSSRQATITLKLRRATIPNARIIYGRSVTTWQPKFRRGKTILVALAGYKPRQSVAFYLYRYEGTNFIYSTTIKVKTNTAGEAVYRLRTGSDDPRGKYILKIPPVEGSHFFNLI